MNSIAEIEQQIVAEFSKFDEWLDRYNYLIELGRECPPILESEKIEANLIKGCQSRVWLSTAFVDGKVVFSADSDAVITKGIASLLIRVFSNQNPDDILNADLTFLDTIGLRTHLSPTRSNGLTSMIKQMKLYAMAYKMKDSK